MSDSLDADQTRGFKYHSINERPQVLLAKGMLSLQDHAILYSLGRGYESKGLILDLGSFCGASAYAMGLGIQDSGVGLSIQRPLHCFDTFLVSNSRINSFINDLFYSRYNANTSQLIPGNLRVDGFREVFDFQTHSVKDLLTVHHGSIQQLDMNQLTESEIEILNIDLGKTLELYEFIMDKFFCGLVRNAVIFQQDIMIPDHWYLLFSMFLLRDHLSLAFFKPNSGWVFRNNGDITPEAVQACIQDLRNPRREFIISCHDACQKWIPEPLHPTVNHSFAFCYIENHGIGAFSNKDELFKYFQIQPESYSGKRILQLSRKKQISA